MQAFEGMWAGLFQGSALVCAIALVGVWPRPPAPRDELLATAGFCCVAAALGGRALWVIVALWRGVEGLSMALVLDPLKGGFSSFGALAAALLTGLVISRRFSTSLGALADFFAPIALVSLAVARLGCLVHGCDFGREVSAWIGVRYFSHAAPVWRWCSSQELLLADGGTPHLFPMPLLLSSGTLLGVCVLVACSRRTHRWPVGGLAARLIVMYGIVRGVGELWRHPAAGAHIDGVNFNLVLAACVCGVGVLAWRVWRRSD